MFHGKNLRWLRIVLGNEHSNSLTRFRFVNGLKVMMMRTLILVVRAQRFSMLKANLQSYVIFSEYL